VGAGAGFDIADAGNTFTLNQALTNTGRVTKLGAGTLALGGNNSAIGGVTLAAGTVSVGSNTALGSGSFNINGSGALDSTAAVTLANDVFIGAGNTLTNLGSNDLTLNGVVAGTTGALAKTGNGTLTLNGANSYAGGTTLSAGAIRVGSNTALGTGLLTVAGASSLLSDSTVALGNGIALNANLTTGGAGNLTLNNASHRRGHPDQVGHGHADAERHQYPRGHATGQRHAAAGQQPGAGHGQSVGHGQRGAGRRHRRPVTGQCHYAGFRREPDPGAKPGRDPVRLHQRRRQPDRRRRRPHADAVRQQHLPGWHAAHWRQPGGGIEHGIGHGQPDRERRRQPVRHGRAACADQHVALNKP